MKASESKDRKGKQTYSCCVVRADGLADGMDGASRLEIGA